jgi:hypothetical protein
MKATDSQNQDRNEFLRCPYCGFTKFSQVWTIRQRVVVSAKPAKGNRAVEVIERDRDPEEPLEVETYCDWCEIDLPAFELLPKQRQ